MGKSSLAPTSRAKRKSSTTRGRSSRESATPSSRRPWAKGQPAGEMSSPTTKVCDHIFNDVQISLLSVLSLCLRLIPEAQRRTLRLNDLFQSTHGTTSKNHPSTLGQEMQSRGDSILEKGSEVKATG